MNPSWLAVACLLAAAYPASAQQGPFDMSPERGGTTQPDPAMPAAIAPVQPAAAAPAATEQPASLRYLLPVRDFVLAGETDSRSWSIYLTPEQAAAPATLNLGYQNAVIVAPEASQLRMFLNGRKLFEMPIASSDKVSEIEVKPPAGLLRAGFNDIRIEAAQRHRTDCTIESTYELWTEIKPDRTYLSFADAKAMAWKRVEDLRAIGVDTKGATVFTLVVPGIGQTASTSPVLKLAEGLALMADMPSQSFVVSDLAAHAPGSGAATVVIGTASELRPIMPELPAGADTTPTTLLTDDPKFGPATLVVTGPTWDAVGKAVQEIVAPVDRKPDVQRPTIATGSWRSPEAPMLRSASRVPLSDLGVATQEFSGRRFRTDFTVGVPADFFANSYGEARILLDAAYSAEVLPGSRVDIYVNDNIAATVPITVAGGEIFRHSPIKVTMRHFKPGQNRIAVEAVLLTDADSVCAPGATALPSGRFVLFDTTEFSMPDYARIGQRPNLAALGGTGFPYSAAETPIPLILDRSQIATVAAAATLLGRMSVAAGRLIAVDTSVSAASARSGNGIVIGAISQVPADVLKQAGVAANTPSSWGESVVAAGGDANQEDAATLDQWRDRVGGDGWRGRVVAFAEWLKRTFNISPEALRLIPGKDADFTPGGGATLMVAQQESPAKDGTWTLFTAPTPQALEEGMQLLTTEANWQQLEGHITTYDAATDTMASLPVGRFSLVATQAGSFANYRLIAANWLSSNTLSYAMLLAVLCVLLGLITSTLLGILGRRQ